VGIFYSESAKGAAQTLYTEILNGIESTQASTKVFEFVEYALAKDFDAEEILKDLRKKQIKNVIVLGGLGYKFAKGLPKDEFQIISGGLPIRPSQMDGISYISDPAKLFGYLSFVNPNVKKVHVAYSKKNLWMIKLAEQAAFKLGLEFEPTEVKDTKGAINYYQALFKSGLKNTDAIWLPYDKVSTHDKYILPFVLEQSWEKGITLFSSKPSHAKRGTLFSTYPDNEGLGRSLVHLLHKILNADGVCDKTVPLDALLLAVNVRTASHLGIKYTPEQQALFQLTFPE
jgi:putative ABC transport system substrate-binding protein